MSSRATHFDQPKYTPSSMAMGPCANSTASGIAGTLLCMATTSGGKPPSCTGSGAKFSTILAVL
jgi:hypothetical protein